MKILIILIMFYSLSFAEVILSKTGIGSTYEEAQKEALNSLTKSFLSEVITTIKIEKKKSKYVNYNYAYNNIKINSNLIFKNLKIKKIITKSSNKKVKVIFDRTSLKSTISYLLSKININYEYLNKKQIFIEQHKYLKTLSVFYPFIHSNKKRLYIKNLINKKENQLNKIQNLGKILFSITNPNVDKVSILIDSVEYFPNKPIFLKKGKYYYFIKSKKYFSYKGSFFINKNSNLDIHITLHKKQYNKFNFYINNNIYSGDILEIFNKNELKENFNIKSKKNNYFNIKIKVIPLKIKIYGVQVYEVKLKVEGYINNKLILTKQFYNNNILDTTVMLYIKESLQKFIDSFYLNLENQKILKH